MNLLTTQFLFSSTTNFGRMKKNKKKKVETQTAATGIACGVARYRHAILPLVIETTAILLVEFNSLEDAVLGYTKGQTISPAQTNIIKGKIV